MEVIWLSIHTIYRHGSWALGPMNEDTFVIAYGLPQPVYNSWKVCLYIYIWCFKRDKQQPLAPSTNSCDILLQNDAPFISQKTHYILRSIDTARIILYYIVFYHHTIAPAAVTQLG